MGAAPAQMDPSDCSTCSLCMTLSAWLAFFLRDDTGGIVQVSCLGKVQMLQPDSAQQAFWQLILQHLKGGFSWWKADAQQPQHAQHATCTVLQTVEGQAYILVRLAGC